MKVKFKKLLLVTVILTASLYSENTAFISTHFSGSQNCAGCHNSIEDAQQNDVSIETAWSSTMMAHAAKDPFWMAKVRAELNRNPGLEEVINDKCSKCHAPMAHKEATYSGHTVKILDDGFLNPANSHHDEALNGVSCTLCHQIKDNGTLGTPEGMSGGYEIDESRLIYGPYGNLLTQPMINNVDYEPRESAHTRASELCATCHNLKTPFVDENGDVISTPENEFPEQMPYTEWEHSDYNGTKSCQDCHMKRVDGVVMASSPGSLNTVRNGFSKHMFVGGNKLLLDILNTNKSELDVTASNFETTISKSDEMLKSAATIQVLEQSLKNGVLEVTLKINSTTGHKLPSSYPSRRVFIDFKVSDEAGIVIFESGKVDANGSIHGANADIDQSTVEPHYDIITSEDQVQIYEAIMQNNLGATTYTLLRAVSYVKDNRILPNGFNKSTAHSDISVRGSAQSDTNFVGGSDTITYRISDSNNAVYTVDVALLYQTLAYGFAQDLFTETSTEVTSFKSMFDASTMKTSQIAATSVTVNSTPTQCDDGIDNDGDNLIDLSDPGCKDAQDNSESDPINPSIIMYLLD